MPNYLWILLVSLLGMFGCSGNIDTCDRTAGIVLGCKDTGFQDTGVLDTAIVDSDTAAPDTAQVDTQDTVDTDDGPTDTAPADPDTDTDSPVDTATDSGAVDTGDSVEDSDADSDTALPDDTGSDDTGDTASVDTATQDTAPTDTGSDDTAEVVDSDTADTDIPPTDTGAVPLDTVDDDLDGYSEADGDCDDAEPTTNPAAYEWDDLFDNDCDLEIDEANTIDGDGDGITEADGDCDDGNPDIYPGATEYSGDETDQDCDGNDDPTTEGDTGDEDVCVPGVELMNWADDTCEGNVDEGCDLSCGWDYVSVDGAGTQCRDDLYAYWVSGNTDLSWECTGTSWRVEVDSDGDGYTASTGDCWEGDEHTYPGAPELMDWLDNDCDGATDEACNLSCGWDYVSVDGDGAACRDDLYSFWLYGDTEFVCTGTSWREVP